MNIVRALAHIEQVVNITPIVGADNIELITILGWKCVAKKNEFKVGDKAVYIEIDSLCPKEDTRFEFLKNRGYKVKTMMLNKFGVMSQGLALPLSLFPELGNADVGDDVTDKLGITYYTPSDVKRKAAQPVSKIDKRLMKYRGYRLFRHIFYKYDTQFPSWIKKTDEVRIENFLPSNRNLVGKKFFCTEKLDGTSCTYAVEKGFVKNRYHVCSRNRRIPKDDGSIYWELFRKYDVRAALDEFLKRYNAKTIVIQGEGVGFVQGNPYKLKENKLYIFNIVVDGVRQEDTELIVRESEKLESVPFVTSMLLPNNIEDIKLMADGNSVLNNDVKREGLVCRLSNNPSVSFKNVSNTYLLKHS